MVRSRPWQQGLLFFFRVADIRYYERKVTNMSERIKQIMEERNVGFEEAFEIMERQNNIMKFLFDYINPYDQCCH